MNEINEINVTAEMLSASGISETGETGKTGGKFKGFLKAALCAIIYCALSFIVFIIGALITSLFSPYEFDYEFLFVLPIGFALCAGFSALFMKALRKISPLNADRIFKNASKIVLVVSLLTLLTAVGFFVFLSVSDYFETVSNPIIALILFVLYILAIGAGVGCAVGGIALAVIMILVINHEKVVLILGGVSLALWAGITIFTGSAPNFENLADLAWIFA